MYNCILVEGWAEVGESIVFKMKIKEINHYLEQTAQT